MITVQITPETPSHMLRAIRAACNELLGETVELRLPTAAVESLADQEQAAPTSWNAGNTAKPGDFSEEVAALGESEQTETDSAGHAWNAELHASTKSKNADGTWKKRRGAAPLVAQSDSAAEQATQAVAEAIAANPGGAVVHDEVQVSALPPLPPTPPTASLVTMNDIYALITNGKAVLNDVIAAAQAMGFADVGAFSRDATPEQRAQLLAQLTKEVA